MEDLFNTSGNEEIIPISTDVGRITREPYIPRLSTNFEGLIPEVLVFLGAGASVPAEVPLILYPGKKLEYSEPVFDLFIALKNYINTASYIVVIGYSFRDDYILRLFQYAARCF